MERFGLIGRPLGHSASAKYFGEKFERERLTATHAYSLYELPSIEALEELLHTTENLRGLNVTIPYKRDVMSYLDELSYDAQCIGAVNCIRIEADGRRTGHNTDIIGIRATLDRLLGATEVEEALILGTGGAAQAVQYALAERGIAYALVSRDPAKGNYTYDNLPTDVVERSKLIINASPVGTYPKIDEAPRIPYAYVTPDHYLYDLVYNPPMTQFLSYGQQRGAHIINGELMFVTQAEASWNIWTK